MVKNYQRKPEQVQAIQLVEENLEEVINFCDGKLQSHPMIGWILETIEGKILVDKGNYILKDEAGNLFSLKESEFSDLYGQLPSNFENWQEGNSPM